METMVNRELIRRLRTERSWTQEHLAKVTGLSLRTVQRVEKDGRCSIETKRALAAVFEIDAIDLDVDHDLAAGLSACDRGARYGMTGAFVGMVSAYIGVSVGWVMGDMDAGQAGVYFGSVGAITGFACALIGTGTWFVRRKILS